MCNTPRYSESGACLGVQRCNEFVLIQSDRDHLASVVQGMEEQSKRNAKELHWHNQRLVEVMQDNARLETTLKCQAKAMQNYQSAEAKIASVNLANARRLAAECDPDNVESEKQMNAILTEENQRLEDEVSRLKNVLESIEWRQAGFEEWSCPVCFSDRNDGHAPSCIIGNAIKEVG